MAYTLGGSNGEDKTFNTILANSAIEAVHDSIGLISMTTVVQPNQGNTYKAPSLAPLGFADYDETTPGTGDDIQTAAIGSKDITATPTVLPTEFGNFLLKTDSIGLAMAVGAEIGAAFVEKVDIRVAGAFTGFKATVADTNFATSADGITRPSSLGALELRSAGETATTAAYCAVTVVDLIRKVVAKWRSSRNQGRPIVVLSDVEADRLVAELTDPTKQMTPAGIELQETGAIQNLYGATVMFSTFLPTASRAIDGQSAATIKVGAAFGPRAITSVLVEGLDIKSGPMDGGLKTWLTGTGYFGAGVSSTTRGFAINME